MLSRPFFSSPDLSVALPRELPQGVIIREATFNTMPLITIDLPFHSFERYLRGNLPILTAKKQPNSSTHVPSTGSNHAEVWGPENGGLKALQVIVPDEQDPFNLPLMTPHTRLFSSPLHRNMVFSVANNFAGIGTLPMEKVFEFLQRETSEGLYRMIRSAPEYFTTQAIALNLFKASIEFGDARMVDFLIRQSLPGITPNRFIYSHRGPRYTPIEIAAALLHKNVVRTLLEHGADANLSDSGQCWLSSRDHGALVYVVKGMYRSQLSERIAQLDPELFEMLVNAGGELDLYALKALIEHDTKGDIVRLIISKHAAKKHKQWSMEGVFHLVFKYQNHENSLETLKIMHENGADINYAEAHYGRILTVIDVVAGHGDLIMIKHLFGAGARFTGDTLPCAISSGNEALVQYLLDHGARTDSMGLLKISPLAAAIRLQIREVLDLVVCPQSLISLGDPEYLRSAFQAALEVRDAKWIKDLGGLGEVRPEDLGTALIVAIKDEQEEFAQLLIDAGADTNSALAFIDSALAGALIRRNAGMVRSLLKAGAEPNDRTEGRESAFRLAVIWGDCRVVQSIIDAGANLNDYSNNVVGAPALSIAVEGRDKDMVAMLLHAGCDINDQTAQFRGESALKAAVKTGDLEMVHYVLEHGADPHDPNALAEAAKQDLAVFELLLRRHAARYPKGRKGWGIKVLKEAIDSDNYDFFTRVLEGGADANHCLEQTTLFGYAIAKSKDIGIKFVELLLQQKQKTHCTPETIVYRVSIGEEGKKQSAKVTAFLAAIGTANIPTIQLLLRHNADVNFPAEFGVKRTPLQRAAELGDIEIVELLLKHGADVMALATRRGGGTALQLAAFGGYIRIVRLLLEHGADVHAPASKVDGRTALEGAAEQGRLDTVTVLLKAGAGYNGRNRGELRQAITFAKENGHSYIADLLNQYLLDGRLSNGPPTFEEFLNLDMDE